MRRRRPLVLALAGLLACTASGCIVFPMRTRQARAGRVVDAASGAPVAGAEVAVSTQKVRHVFCGVAERSYVTLTDADGRWRAPPRHALRFMIAMPDGGYEYVDRYEATAPSGRSAKSPDPCPYGPGVPGASETKGLKLEVGDAEPVAPDRSFTLGLVLQADQRFSAYIGHVWFVAHAPLRLGLRGGAPGLDGGALGTAVVAMPRLADVAIPLPGLAVGFRYLQPWLRDKAERARFGPELSLYLVSLRLSVTAYSPRLGASLRDRDYVVGGGVGYL